MNRPKVSVSLITYNHEKYIAACLDSIIKQVTGFEFEIVVSDDCSTDKTPEIIADYALQYPNLIKPILRKTNVGMVKNGIETMKACTGQYIAVMEGDDFWCDEHKLQTQSDYLDKNTDCVICFTNGYIFFEDDPGKTQFFFTNENKPLQKFNQQYFLYNNILIPNNTKMFRSDAQPEVFPDWIYSTINWDWVLHVLQSLKGNIGYIDLVTLGYRRHSEAAFALKSETNILLDGIATATQLNKYLGYKYDSILKNQWWEYHELAHIYLRQGNWGKFLNYYLKYFANLRHGGRFNLRDEVWMMKQSLKGKKYN